MPRAPLSSISRAQHRESKGSAENRAKYVAAILALLGAITIQGSQSQKQTTFTTTLSYLEKVPCATDDQSDMDVDVIKCSGATWAHMG